MSNFVVSARKYRPDHFNSVVGQSHITRTLKTAIKSNQLAQAFLFCGPRGVGKTSCARILAKTINCTNISADFEACDTCDSCVSFRNGTSFNIHELDAASNNSVEDIRALVEQVRYAPQAGKYKIYIIDEVHMLSSSAFNAFLKTLEEPPAYAIFILATTEKQKIIPTILSRCQIFEFHRIQVKDIASHLAYIAGEEKINFEPEALHIIAQKADGALRDALSSFDQLSIFTDGNITYREVIENLNILDYDYYFKIGDALLAEEIPQALIIFDEILRNGFNGNDFMNGLCSHFRDLLVSKDAGTVKLLEVTDQTRSRYLDQSSRASTSFLLSALSIGNQCEINYRTSKNPRLQVELALMKMCHISSAFKFQQNPDRGGEKKNPELNQAPQQKVSLESIRQDIPVESQKSDAVGAIHLPASTVILPSPLIPGSLAVTVENQPEPEPFSNPPVSADTQPSPAVIALEATRTAIPVAAPAAQTNPTISAPAVALENPTIAAPVVAQENPTIAAPVVAQANPVAQANTAAATQVAEAEPAGKPLNPEEEAGRLNQKPNEKARSLAPSTGKPTAVKIRIPTTAELLKKLEPLEDTEETPLPAIEEEDMRPIDYDMLVVHWKAYAYLPEILAKINIFTILTAYDPDLEDGRNIKIKVENSFQLDLLQPEIPPLLKYLKDTFKHRSLGISVRILEAVEEKKQALYSSQDRYIYLAEKNPLLNDFKSRLDLEIER